MASVLRVGLGALLTAILLALPLRAAEKNDIDKAIENGVAHLKSIQDADGMWHYTSVPPNKAQDVGATALAGLTLLECDVPIDDPAILKAVKALREACISLDSTYSLSLCILFLDRLGDADDVPLIESMVVRLMAGQTGAGGWSYRCPLPPAGDLVRLKTVVNEKAEKKAPAKGEVTKGSSESDKASQDAKDKKEPRKPSKEIQGQIDALTRGGGLQRMAPALGGIGGGTGDNSNTQFAILALWVGRRHGMPVDQTLARVDARFRQSQNSDGGWSYTPHPEGMPAGQDGMLASSPAMTCAGLLGLAAGQGAAMAPVLKAGGSKKDKEKDKDKEGSGEAPAKKEPGVRDLSKDVHVKAGLKALGKWVGEPIEKPGDRIGPPMAMMAPAHKTFYSLWSLERVAVAYDLNTIGNKDWYAWGSDIIVGSQRRDGSWSGGYAAGGVDTSFALLFLRRANLARDLTTVLKGKVTDPDRVVLKAGPGGDNEAKPEIKEGTNPKPEPREPTPPDRKPADPIKEKPESPKTAPSSGAENDPARMAQELVQANPAKQERLLANLRESKGAEFTQALLKAIPKLDGDIKKKARDALAERMSRMTSATLQDRLKDDDAEMRRAAALAAAMKEDTSHVPRLIELLYDSDVPVSRAAHAALKSLSGKDFGPEKDASRTERADAVAAWKSWWKEKSGK
jgi:hypothetical protein